MRKTLCLLLCLAASAFGAEAPPTAVRCVFPQQGQVIEGNSVRVQAALEHHRSGQRIRLILDNGAPQDLPAPDHALVLKNLPEGGHTLRLWASRANGAALANPEAFTLVRFFVGRRDFQNRLDPETPFLTATLPEEGMDGGIDHQVTFDFLLANAVLSKDGGFVVRCSLNQQQRVLTERKAVTWEDLTPGRYQFTAELLTSDLEPVPGLFNRVTRMVDVPMTARALPPVGTASRKRPED
ncbi:MAG: hypothetical protein PW734_10240 [Verrucomicrobium sp.]|nr:hypothetical protein [Verrucomicrobium sp.]